MAKLSNREIDAAIARGNAAGKSEPRAASVQIDGEMIVVTLTSGIIMSIPAHLIQGLERATADQIANVVVEAGGYGLHWPSLDIDLSVPGLVAGMTGTRSYIARLAGQSTSKVKATAARKNGLKGGRPRKPAAA